MCPYVTPMYPMGVCTLKDTYFLALLMRHTLIFHQRYKPNRGPHFNTSQGAFKCCSGSAGSFHPAFNCLTQSFREYILYKSWMQTMGYSAVLVRRSVGLFSQYVNKCNKYVSLSHFQGDLLGAPCSSQTEFNLDPKTLSQSQSPWWRFVITWVHYQLWVLTHIHFPT